MSGGAGEGWVPLSAWERPCPVVESCCYCCFETVEFILALKRLSPGLTPTKGKGSNGINTFGVTALKQYPALDLVTYSDELAKDELYASIITRGELASLHLPSDASGEFIRGLSGQVKEKKPSGRAEWKKLPDDHFGDCLKLCRISWWLNRVTLEPALFSRSAGL